MESHYQPNPTEVLTLEGAGLFSGKTPKAVRLAAERGRVQAVAVVRFGAKPDLLIDLASATKCWPITDPLRQKYVESDLREMRRCAVDFVVDERRYKVLHPRVVVEPRPMCQHVMGGWNLDCDQPPCSPDWYK